ELSAGRTTRLGGNIVADVKVDIWADFMTGRWVTPVKIFGGDLAFGATVPFGEPGVRAGLLLDGPIINRLLGRSLALSARDRDLNFGDPVMSTALGWHAGNWHWKLGAAASIPAGAYEPGELSNVAFNRWIGDFTAGLTYLDPTLGIDLSAVGGFEVNGDNPDTDYRSGNALHLDLSATKYLTKELSVGVIASHYQQVTGDSGAGATLGPYKGRVTAVGGTLGYTFEVGKIRISTRLKVLREVDVENRFEGTIGFLQVSFPLWVPPHAAPPQPVTAKF
ncbi:MAG TPA: transporter, partial [Beijerinckiaceae bacterium]|nr:transporter [Beijerinckiaceae bacterium]